MKKFIAVLLSILLLLGTGTMAIAKPSSKTTMLEKSTYEFKYILPEDVEKDENATLEVTLKTKVLGQNGYDDAYIEFSATGPGSVNFSKDSSITYVDQGALDAFDLPAQYNVTTNWIVRFTEDGTYNITFQLFDEDDNELAVKTRKFKVTDRTTVTDSVYSDTENTGNTHGLLNALQAHLRIKNNGNPKARVQSTNRLMELLLSRGMSQDELDNAIEKMEEAIAGEDNDTDNYKVLSKMKELKGKKYETYIDGKKVIYDDIQPLLVNNRTLIPFRKLAEILGAEVTWDSEKKQVNVTKDGKTVVITIDKGVAMIDGEVVTIDTPAKIYKNRTMIPLRFLAEAFDLTVDYYPEGCLISIKKNMK